MFEVSVVSDTDFDKVVLKDLSAHTIVEIIPSCGGILHAFTVVNNGMSVNIIDSYENTTDFKNNVAAKGFKSCKLSPFACRIKDACYNFAGKAYTVEKFLLNGSALHGLLYDAAFSLINQSADENTATVSLQYQYTGTDKGYPFNYTCAITYELKENNTLTLTTSITNTSEVDIPMQDGWHPYFTFGKPIDQLQLEFQSKEMVEFDNALIPTGKLLPYQGFGSLEKIEAKQFDNCFTVNFAECQPMCVVRDKEAKMQLEIYPDKSYPYLQLYTPSQRKSIAIENLSAIPDAFNNGVGLKIMSAGEVSVFKTIYKITLLS
jgi:aldose 1-epimerase